MFIVCKCNLKQDKLKEDDEHNLQENLEAKILDILFWMFNFWTLFTLLWTKILESLLKESNQ